MEKQKENADNFEIFSFFKSCKEYRKCIESLFDLRIINKESKNEILENIDKYESENNCFITKPFRTCDTMGKSLFNLMRSLSGKIKFEENNEN